MRSLVLVFVALLSLAACQTAVEPPPPAPLPEPTPLPEPQCPQLRFYEEGISSWYGPYHHGRKTASGAIFDMNAMTAAHRRLRLGTRVRVTNLANSRHVDIEINDRGPYVRGRILDVSRGVAEKLGFEEKGLTRVRIEILTPCS